MRPGAASTLRKTTTLLLAALFFSALAAPSPAGAATRRTPTLAPSNTVVDGPSADIDSLGGLAVGRDGSGGLVYLKHIGATAHVFVSTLVNGSFQPPVQTDAGLPGASSQPVIAATNGGQLVIAFINGGKLYGVTRVNALTGFSAPLLLAGGASNPAISMSPFGKAYVAFTAAGQGGHDVRSAYYFAGAWGVESAPLDANPADDAGTGGGRPDVVTSGDGTAIVVWGENGHVYSRRVLGTSPSIVDEQADPPSVEGWNEVSASDPAVSSGGDSSYAAVAFDETVANGSQEQTRVLVNRLVASEYVGVSAADGLSPINGADAGQPNVVVNEYGSGFVTADNIESDNLFATTLGNSEVPISTSQVNTEFQQTQPDAAIGVAGTVSTLIAWQQDPGSSTVPEIRMRYASDGVTLNPEEVVSSPTLGPTEAGQGLFAGGDLAGDSAIAWVQGTGGQTRIVTAQLFQAPGGMTPAKSSRYTNSVYPIFSWSPASELWGPPSYVVKTGGVVVATTTSDSVRSSLPLSQGRHVWQVTAVNRAGLTNISRTATVFVDSIPPRVTIKHSGAKKVGSPLRLRLSYTDTPRGMGASVASGVASVQVKWGDGKSTKIRVGDHTAAHLYRRRGRFTVTVTLKDKAGNNTVKKVRIKVGGGSGKSHGRRRSHTVRHGRTSVRGALAGTGSLTGTTGAGAAPTSATGTTQTNPSQTGTAQTSTTPGPPG